MPSQVGQRLAFQNAANAVTRAGMNPGNAVLSQSFLRCEAVLSSSATTYKFDVLTTENLNGTIVTQQKLNLQDAFVVSQIGVFLACPSGLTDNAFNLLTYPTVGTLAGGAGNFTAAQAVTTIGIYNGQMQLTVNQRTIITAWDLSRHLRIPTTQQNATITSGASGTLVAPVHNAFDSLDLANDGFYPCEPNLVINGGKKNDLTIVLPAAITAPNNARVVIVFRGILAQNVTSVN
jgi:hypothetical protein